MSKLNEAVEAGCKAAAAWAATQAEPLAKWPDDFPEEEAEAFRGIVRAAIQAAVKVLMPEQAPTDSIYIGDAAWNNCRVQIFKNAGIEE